MNVLGQWECARQVLAPGCAVDWPQYPLLFTQPLDRTMWPKIRAQYLTLLPNHPASAAGWFLLTPNTLQWTAPDGSQCRLTWPRTASSAVLTIHRAPTSAVPAALLAGVCDHRAFQDFPIACYVPDHWLKAWHHPLADGQQVLWLPGVLALYQKPVGETTWDDWLITPEAVYRDADHDVVDIAWMATAPLTLRQRVWHALGMDAIIALQEDADV